MLPVTVFSKSLTDVPQKIHLGHCHAGPCQWSTEGASRSFSSFSLINTLLIGCWEDSSDDWLLRHLVLLSDFVEPYWNQSETIQIVLFLMGLAEGSSTCDDISSAKHNPHHQASGHPRPLFIVSGKCKKLLSTLEYQIQIYQIKTGPHNRIKTLPSTTLFRYITYFKGCIRKGFLCICLLLSVLTATFFLPGRNFEKIRNRKGKMNKEKKGKNNVTDAFHQYYK